MHSKSAVLQMIPADYSRPLELHMHHHHHHYVASPTSPFSQTVNTAYYGEPEVVAPVADLSIRVGSLHSQAFNAISVIYPLLGLHKSH